MEGRKSSKNKVKKMTEVEDMSFHTQEINEKA